MASSVWFTIARRLAPLGILLLALGPSAAAEGFETAALPGPDGNDPTSVPMEQSELSLGAALQLALRFNPELAVSAREMRALEGTTLQAGLLRNPNLTIEAEDLGAPANGAVHRFTTFRVSQLIELGGKRSARISAAASGQELAGQDYEAKRLELIAQVADGFTDVLAGQERLRLAQESERLAQQVVHAVSRRVQAGKVPPIEETRARVAFSSVQIELEQARRDLAAARKRLALLWGNPMPQFSRAQGDLETAVALPAFEKLAEQMRASPLARRSLKDVAQRKAQLALEQARRIPDITVDAGLRRYAQLADTTAVVSLSVPLPLFDRNQGNLLAAHQRVNQAIDQLAATDLRLTAELVRVYEALAATRNEIDLLRSEILPGAKSAFEITNRGYELGKFGFLEMLDAQRTLFQNQILYVRVLAQQQRLVNELERLIAAPLGDLADAADGGDR